MPSRQSLKEILSRILPQNDLGDAVFALMTHVFSHRSLPHVAPPRTYNEHLLRAKISRDFLNPLMGFVTDKDLVKDFISARVGNDYNIATLAVLGDEAAIDSYEFPASCVIKPTSGCGDVILRRDASAPIDRALLKSWLRQDFYRYTRQKNYKNLRNRIIVEELLLDDDGDIPDDYKIYCFKGVPAYVRVTTHRLAQRADSGAAAGPLAIPQTQQAYFSPSWNRLPLEGVVAYMPTFHGSLPKPAQLPEMLDLARRLSKDFPHLRVDLYLAKGKIKVGELTLVPGNGKIRFVNPLADVTVGQLFQNPHLNLEDTFLGTSVQQGAVHAAE